MDQELKTKLMQYLETLEAKAADGMDFVASEAPLVAQEWLAFNFWTAMGGIAISVLLLVIAVIAGCVLRREFRKDFDKRGPEVEVPAAFILLGAAVAGCVVGGTQTYQLIKVTTAPRIVILEKIQELTR
jgi:uncharacterized integral membrane protein